MFEIISPIYIGINNTFGEIMLLSNIEGLCGGSHKIVEATCDFEISEKCRKIIKNPYRDMRKYMANNDGKNICLPCSRRLKACGILNGNSKYSFDTNFLKVIDTEEKAYLLGWLGSDGCFKQNSSTILINKRDAHILVSLKNLLCENIPVRERRNNFVELTINSLEFQRNACSHLGIGFGKKSYTISFPNLPSDITWHFLRGYFDGDGSISKVDRYKSDLNCKIASKSEKMRIGISSFLQSNNIKCWNYERGSVEIWNNHAYKFLCHIYDDCNEQLKLIRKYNRFVEWRTAFDFTKDTRWKRV